MLPNIVIAGVPKAGTTSMHRWLTDHPEVTGPTVKETGYFVDKSSHAYKPEANILTHGVEGYSQFFQGPKADARIVIEVAPDYMCQEAALEHLPSIPTRPLIVFFLREPAEQIFSTFSYLKNNRRFVPEQMTFSKFVELAAEESPQLAHHELLQKAISNCRYVEHLERWITRCGEERVKVYLFDDFVADNKAFMQHFCADFGIDAGFYDSYEFPRENETYRARSSLIQALNVSIRQKLPKGRLYDRLRSIYRKANTKAGSGQKTEEDRQTLRALRRAFKQDNQRLAERHGLDLSNWAASE